VKKASEYRHHALECRALARNAKADEHRAQLLKMAETWEALASERERVLKQRALAEMSCTAVEAEMAEYSGGSGPIPAGNHPRPDITAA